MINQLSISPFSQKYMKQHMWQENCTVTACCMYSLGCRQIEAPPNTTAQSEQLSQFDTEFNLAMEPFLEEEDVVYNIRVYARNEEGESSGSNTISFIKFSGQW